MQPWRTHPSGLLVPWPELRPPAGTWTEYTQVAPVEPDEMDEWAQAHKSLLEHLYLVADAQAPEGLGMCGCGRPGDVWMMIRGILALTPLYENGNWQKAQELIGTDGAFYLVLYSMDNAGLLEHGGSVGGSWITPKGAWVHWALDQVVERWGEEEADEVIGIVGRPHYGSDVPPDQQGECGPDCWSVPTEDAA